jgi:hypothetical protein
MDLRTSLKYLLIALPWAFLFPHICNAHPQDHISAEAKRKINRVLDTELGFSPEWTLIESWAEAPLRSDSRHFYMAALITYVEKTLGKNIEQSTIVILRKKKEDQDREYEFFVRSGFWPSRTAETANGVEIRDGYLWYYSNTAFFDENKLKIRFFQFRLKNELMSLIGHELYHHSNKDEKNESETYAGCSINYSIRSRIDWRIKSGRYEEISQEISPNKNLTIVGFTGRSKEEIPNGMDVELLCSESPKSF